MLGLQAQHWQLELRKDLQQHALQNKTTQTNMLQPSHLVPPALVPAQSPAQPQQHQHPTAAAPAQQHQHTPMRQQ
jgi:hypothetical protein